jgi:hypothetical protein
VLNGHGSNQGRPRWAPLALLALLLAACGPAPAPEAALTAGILVHKQDLLDVDGQAAAVSSSGTYLLTDHRAEFATCENGLFGMFTWTGAASRGFGEVVSASSARPGQLMAVNSLAVEFDAATTVDALVAGVKALQQCGKIWATETVATPSGTLRVASGVVGFTGEPGESGVLACRERDRIRYCVLASWKDDGTTRGRDAGVALIAKALGRLGQGVRSAEERTSRAYARSSGASDYPRRVPAHLDRGQARNDDQLERAHPCSTPSPIGLLQPFRH